jgi:hypothetical protein
VHLQSIPLLNYLEAFTTEIRILDYKPRIWLWANETATICKRMYDGDNQGPRGAQNPPDLS